MGCVNICDYCPIWDWQGYKEWTHYIPTGTRCIIDYDGDPWPDPQEIIQLIRQTPLDLWLDISRNAERKTLEENTYLHRAYYVFSLLNMPQLANQALETAQQYRPQ